jgi:hypothetical protein
MGECGGEVVLNAERGRDGELRVGLGGAIAGAKGFGKLALGGGAGARGIGLDGGDELAEPRREPSFGGGASSAARVAGAKAKSAKTGTGEGKDGGDGAAKRAGRASSSAG